MRRMTVLFFCVLLASCAKVETASTVSQISPEKTPVAATPIAEKTILLKPVVPKLEFNAEQRKNLNESLPSKVREILEKAEKFEVLAEVDNNPDGMNFEPNRVSLITDEADKKQLLEAFYNDASDGDYPSACFIPHHGIRAEYKGQVVEIQVCFQCHNFSVKSPFGSFDGGIVRENSKSGEIFERIIKNQSIELKQ